MSTRSLIVPAYALSQINGMPQVSSKKIWIARPSATDSKKGTILPVDYDAITSRGATATNYQLFPGDRLFIADKKSTEGKKGTSDSL